MTSYLVHGGCSLQGDIYVQGSKNAALPMLAASLLNQGVTRLYGCPRISDVDQMLHILRYLGCKVYVENDYVEIHSENARYAPISENDACQMRSSIFLMGALLGRFGEVNLPYPGGCQIGDRPLDIHLEALRRMNVALIEDTKGIYGYTTGIYGTEMELRYPSVGATENIILAAVKGNGRTRIINAAREPEIVDLCLMLNKMGADIHGMGTKNLTIYGVTHLHDVSYTVSVDRIVAATYLIAAAATSGNVRLMNVWEHDIKSVLQVLAQMGCGIMVQSKKIRVVGPQILCPIEEILTQPFPGFPTDVQSQIMVCLTGACGKSRIREHVFEKRFQIVPELEKMGARIDIQGRCANIMGMSDLIGSTVNATDLRASAGLFIAGLMAEGTTIIHDENYIRRGYQDICGDLNLLGAAVEVK